MGQIRRAAAPVDSRDMELTVVAGRPVRLMDGPVNGKYPYTWHRGPKVLGKWLASRRKP